MFKKDLSESYEKCANYSTLGILLMNTVKSMKRFSQVSDEKIIKTVYTKLKDKAAKHVAS